jgi:DNA-binding transcriptional ArsR family regulator
VISNKVAIETRPVPRPLASALLGRFDAVLHVSQSVPADASVERCVAEIKNPGKPLRSARGSASRQRTRVPASPRAAMPGCQKLTAKAPVGIVHCMVNYRERQLDRTFAALVDGTRRAILARLEREDSASVSDLAKPFAIKLPAVMKHLDVLYDAGLITRSKAGRVVTVRIRPEPMRQAMDWLRRYERFWSKSLDRLAAYAESQEAEARKKRR